MAARLVIEPDAYRLEHKRGDEWVELAVLQGGDIALLPAGAGLGEAQLERAIEIAEDWLMPHARGMAGEELEVLDAVNRLKTGLAQVDPVVRDPWTVDAIESLFLALVDGVLRMQQGPAGTDLRVVLADVLLLRELAHHGQLRGISLG